MMLFRAFSVRSVNEIKPARLSGGAVAGCGLLCAKPGTFIHDLARIDGLSIDLPHNGALFLNKEHPVPLSCTMNIPRLLFVSLKINHVDYQAALYDSAFPLHAENVFFQLIIVRIDIFCLKTVLHICDQEFLFLANRIRFIFYNIDPFLDMRVDLTAHRHHRPYNFLWV